MADTSFKPSDNADITYRDEVKQAREAYDLAVEQARIRMLERYYQRGAARGPFTADHENCLRVGDIVWIQGDSRLQGFGIDWVIIAAEHQAGAPTIVRVKDYNTSR